MAIRYRNEEQIRATPFHPRLFGTHCAITSEHYLAANAGADILKAGGNAVDAAVAAVFVEGVVNPHQHTLCGECPMLIQMADRNQPVVINGNTMAPAAANVEAYLQRGLNDVPDVGILAAGVPAAFDALTVALENFGTLSLAEVCHAALKLARDGFAAHRGLLNMADFGVHENATRFRRDWPNTAEIYLPQGKVPSLGQLLCNPALANLLQTLVSTEKAACGTREKGIEAARREFYRGDIATEIARHSKERDGFLVRSDLEVFETQIERAVSVKFDHFEVFKCGPWNQGPVLLQALSILKNLSLRSMGHNQADYLHTVIEAIKLAFADREQWYADPKHVNVPIASLLDDTYGKMRAELIDSRQANAEVRPGNPFDGKPLLPVEKRLGGKSWGHGTVHVDAIDREGNMVSATPSGAWLKSSEVVKALGVPLGNRLMTFYLAPDNHPNVVEPHKQPRTTISPTLVYRSEKPWMVYGSMGGDQQDQWMLQFLLNRTVFDMTIAESIEAPKFSSQNAPGFFAPHERIPNHVNLERRIGKSVIAALESRGHEVNVVPDWTEGFLLAIERDANTGLLEAGYDPRGAKGDVFPAAAYCW